MKKILIALMFLTSGLAVTAQAKGSLGAGAHYWTAVDSIDTDEIDDSGFSYLASFQVMTENIIKLEGDLEVFPDGFAGQTETTYAPQALAIVGGLIYGGLGIGVNYADSNFADDPFYIIRAGVNLPLLPGVHIDINGNYEFVEWDNIEDLDEKIDTDTVTLGAAVRFDL